MREIRSGSDFVGLLPLATGLVSWVFGRTVESAVYGGFAGAVAVTLWGMANGKFSGRQGVDRESTDDDDSSERAPRNINPATGLPMMDEHSDLDIGGNRYGFSAGDDWK